MLSNITHIIIISAIVLFLFPSPTSAQSVNNRTKTEKKLEDLDKEIDDLKKRISELENKSQDDSGLKLSGFFDVYMSNYQNKPNIFEIGSLELFLEHNYKQHLNVAAALVFDEGAELGVGFIDYHFFGGSISPRGRLYEQKGIHIQVGKFDVPFGNDWQYFSAIDRISVTAPLTTELVMEDGYNDVGIRLLSNFLSFNTTMYLLRGIEEGYSYGGNSFGGRIGFTPFNNPYTLKAKAIPRFELGLSTIIDVDKAWSVSEKLYAIDLDSKNGPFIVSAEYYYRDKTVGIVLNGFHVTGGFDFNENFALPITLYLRYGLYHFERYKKLDEEHNLSRITTGLNINLYKISYLKLEYIRFLQTYNEYIETDYYNENLVYVQLMITF